MDLRAGTVLSVLALLASSHCARSLPAQDRELASNEGRSDAESAPVDPASSAVIDAEAPYQPPLSAYGTEDENLAKGQDSTLPAGTRLVALQMYARDARAAGHGAAAAKNIFALKGQINAMLGDPVYDAIALTGSPAAIPLLLSTGELQHCQGADVPSRNVSPDTLRDPDATITLDLSSAFATVVTVSGLVQDAPESSEAGAAVPDLVQALRCGDDRIRIMAGQSIGNVHRLQPADVAALIELLHHPRARTRALAATLLALAPDAPPLPALEKALADPDQEVQLAAAAALVRLHHPSKGLPAIQRLARSKYADIAAAAKQVLAENQGTASSSSASTASSASSASPGASTDAGSP